MKGSYDELDIYTDGASRGNPGDAAWAFLIFDREGNIITKQSGYIGRATNTGWVLCSNQESPEVKGTRPRPSSPAFR